MRRLMCALALMIAAPAWAQGTEAEPQTASGALELIAEGNAEGVFEARPSEPHTIVVRHERSSLECRMNVEAENRLVIYPQAARGEDVSCETTADGTTITLYATRYPMPTTIDEQVRGAEYAIRTRFPDARPYRSTVDIQAQGLPPHRTAELFITRGGVRYFTSATIAEVGGWVIKQRYTERAETDEAARQAELKSGLNFTSVLLRLIESRTPAE
jgi:hypothetical protein